MRRFRSSLFAPFLAPLLAATILLPSLACAGAPWACPSEGLLLRFSVEGDPQRAQRLLTQRLAATDRRCTVATVKGGEIEVRVADPVPDRAALLALLTTPGELRLAANAEEATYRAWGEALAAASPQERAPRFETHHLEFGRDELPRIRPRVEAVGVPAGHRVAYEEGFGEGAVWLLQDADVLLNPEVADVRLQRDIGDAIRLTLGAADAARFGALTAENVKKALPISLDDTLLIAPIVLEPIPGGRLTLSLSPGPPGQVERLLAQLAGPGLPPMRLESETTFRGE